MLGLDIGGANLKAYHLCGMARSRPFPVWRRPRDLAAELGKLLAALPPADALAVTMTAELCDCFNSKAEGVRFVLGAVQSAAGDQPVLVWTTAGRFVALPEAMADPLPAAASNWLVLAAYAARRFAPTGPALLMDVGSTTSDIIPLQDGAPVPSGRTDPARLAAGELLYQGVRRTPLCAVLAEVDVSLGRLRTAAEFFASTHDAYLALGLLPEDGADTDTADGRPATIPFARRRLARLVCADLDQLAADDPERITIQVKERQLRLLEESMAAVSGRLPAAVQTVVAAGSGEFLAVEAAMRALPHARLVRLSEVLGKEASAAACAVAVAEVGKAARCERLRAGCDGW